MTLDSLKIFFLRNLHIRAPNRIWGHTHIGIMHWETFPVQHCCQIGRGVFYRAVEGVVRAQRDFKRKGSTLGLISAGCAHFQDQRKSEDGVLGVTRRKSCVLRKTVTSVQGHDHSEGTPLSPFHLQGLPNSQPSSRPQSKQTHFCSPYRVTSHFICGGWWGMDLGVNGRYTVWYSLFIIM